MFNSIFGALGQSALTGQGIYQNNPQGLQNAYGSQQAQAMNQQMFDAYNKAQQQRTARWMVDGVVCHSVKDFARTLFPEDEGAQMMLVLKFGDK